MLEMYDKLGSTNFMETPNYKPRWVTRSLQSTNNLREIHIIFKPIGFESLPANLHEVFDLIVIIYNNSI